MLNSNMVRKFYLAILRSPADGESGGAGEDGSGSEASAGEGGGAADASPSPAAAASFLTSAGKPAEAAPAPEGEAAASPAETPATFDLAAVVLPDGVELDAEVGKAFSELLSNAELSPQERGQQLLDLHTTALQTAATAAMEKVQADNLEAYNKMNADWRKEIPNLPEFKDNPEAEGGKVMQALLSIGADQKFFDALDLTGAGNHPEILRVLHRLTKPYMEGGAVGGTGAPASKKTLGANMYTSTAR